MKNATLLDFWQWAFCDLCDDDIKGIFAEWVVAKLLEHKGARRVSWANSDLILDGSSIRIEIKATAFWQSYKLIDEFGKTRSEPIPIRDRSQIRFSGLKARDASADHPEMEKGYKSDLYVFAFQSERDPFKWNAMDMTQWEFYLAGKDDLRYNSIALAALEKLGRGRLTADELADELKSRIALLEECIANRPTEKHPNHG